MSEHIENKPIGVKIMCWQSVCIMVRAAKRTGSIGSGGVAKQLAFSWLAQESERRGNTLGKFWYSSKVWQGENFEGKSLQVYDGLKKVIAGGGNSHLPNGGLSSH